VRSAPARRSAGDGVAGRVGRAAAAGRRWTGRRRAASGFPVSHSARRRWACRKRPGPAEREEVLRPVVPTSGLGQGLPGGLEARGPGAGRGPPGPLPGQERVEDRQPRSPREVAEHVVELQGHWVRAFCWAGCAPPPVGPGARGAGAPCARRRRRPGAGRSPGGARHCGDLEHLAVLASVSGRTFLNVPGHSPGRLEALGPPGSGIRGIPGPRQSTPWPPR